MTVQKSERRVRVRVNREKNERGYWSGTVQKSDYAKVVVSWTGYA